MPSATFKYITLAAARQQLANRLYDSAQVFWSAAELTLYITEALRTFNAYASYWRGEFEIRPTSGVQWYDIPALTGSLRPYTVTDQVFYPYLQYSLLEPAPATVLNPWTGASLQFSADDLVQSLARSRDLVLAETGCTYVRRLVPAAAGRTQLSDRTIDLRRVAYLPATGSGYGIGAYGAGPYGISPALAFTMWPEDAWALEAFRRKSTLRAAGNPQYYTQSTQPPISFDTDRPPGSGGNYECLTIEAGADLSPATTNTLAIPDDWTHILKWGTLGDLLMRDSNAADDTRAQYCLSRFKMGIKMLQSAPAIIGLRNQNTAATLQIDSVKDLDFYKRTWQSGAPGPPKNIGYAGLNLIAMSPIPDAGNYSFVASVVENAPVPVVDGDFVECNRGDLDAILGYAQHIASFKQGGAEFLATLPLYDRFLRQCSNYHLKYDELGEYTSFQLGLAQLQENRAPRMAPDDGEAA